MDVVGEEAAAVAEAVPVVEDPPPNATGTQVESTALSHSTMKPVGYTGPSPSTISTDICATIATTITRARRVLLRRVRRTEEYILPDSDDEPVDLPIIPQALLPTSRDQIPTSAPSPVPSSTASDREAHNQAFLAAGCDDETDDWLHYPEYDPIYQLIPQGLRPLTEREQANRDWPNYDSEQSEHSDDPPRDLRDEYPEHFEEAEQEEYRRYRLRGGEKRYRPSDIGDEDIYRTPNLPLSSDATDGCYLDDHEHLSPSIDRLISWDYRQSIRPWYNNLSPPRQRTWPNWNSAGSSTGPKLTNAVELNPSRNPRSRPLPCRIQHTNPCNQPQQSDHTRAYRYYANDQLRHPSSASPKRVHWPVSLPVNPNGPNTTHRIATHRVYRQSPPAQSTASTSAHVPQDPRTASACDPDNP
jgi:hypothetical protein